MAAAYKRTASGRTTEEDYMLEALDSAPLQWYHFKSVLIAGAGFFTDAYDLFIISIVVPIFSYVYYADLPNKGRLSRSDDLWIKGVALVGTLIGQVAFGIAGDVYGRKKIYLYTLLLMISATVAQALAASTVRGVGSVAVLCFWRLMLGIGVGGDYPLSATIASEYANKKWRGAMIATVFAMQGFGILFGALAGVIVLRLYRDQIYQDISYLDYCWRILIGIGCIPAALTIWLRAGLPETPRYTMHVIGDITTALRDVGSFMKGGSRSPTSAVRQQGPDTITLRCFTEYMLANGGQKLIYLFGTCATWFFLDVAYYSQNLFLPEVLNDMGYLPAVSVACDSATGKCTYVNSSVYDRLYKTALGNAFVALMGTVPGYWFTVVLVDKIGRRPIQFMGFTVMAVLLVVMSITFKVLQRNSNLHWLFLVLYAATFFFSNFGPNATTFIVPAEAFATKYRATCHGVSAAWGKAGAIVGAFGFGELALRHGSQVTLGILSIFVFAGLLCTFAIPETKGRTLEELEVPRAFRAGRANNGQGAAVTGTGVELHKGTSTGSARRSSHNGSSLA